MKCPQYRGIARLAYHGCRPISRFSQVRSAPFRGQGQDRRLSFEAIPAALVPPVVFTGLLITLWTYKCLMMVIFQNKIIYMPSVPPFSRSELVSDYAAQCRPVEWTEHNMTSKDGTSLKILTGSITPNSSSAKRIVVLYCQGNASSLPPRLPYLSSILKAAAGSQGGEVIPELTIVALSYRGYWKSKGRPSQRGIVLDTEAALEWTMKHYDSENTEIVIWGQSIGAGVTCVSAANLLKKNPVAFKRVKGLLLETPFVDLRAMLVALYPQKFLPYRYLGPFLKSTWDSKTALEQIGDSSPDIKVMMLQAGDDEIVPDGQAAILENVCKQRDIPTERQVISRALHSDIMTKGQGKSHIVRFLRLF